VVLGFYYFSEITLKWGNKRI